MIHCVFCGTTTPVQSFPPAPTYSPKGWDWFTGYMSDTAHCCPACRRQHHAQWMALYDLAQVPPQPGERRRPTAELVAAVLARKG